jgi:2-amino-4-hydroxy-6-hydroxymethyldihydropteridine diphosphokinase
MAAAVVAYIGLGSNLADPRAQIERAFDELARMPDSALLARSSAWASAPWGRTDQPEFVNAAAAVATALSAEDLLRALLDIERRGGRER